MQCFACLNYFFNDSVNNHEISETVTISIHDLSDFKRTLNEMICLTNVAQLKDLLYSTVITNRGKRENIPLSHSFLLYY